MISKSLNLTAPINSSGYGTAALNLLLSLSRLTGVRVALFPLGGGVEAPKEHQGAVQAALDARHLYDPEAPSVRLYHQFDLSGHVGRGPRWGFTIFELDRFTDVERHQMESLDGLLVPSRWAASVCRQNGLKQKNIGVVPLGVDREIFRDDHPGRAPSGETVFLNVGKWEVRKGHDVLLKAFELAFRKDDEARLVVHAHNPFVPPHMDAELYNRQWQRYYACSPLAGKIKVSCGRLKSQHDVASLMAGADCGVLPGRAEGWNLEALEFLSMGKHLIVTDYSAHTEFCTDENAMLIPVEGVEEAHDGVWFHGQGNWAALGDKEIKLLAERMREVHDRKKKNGGFLEKNEAGVETAKRFTWDNAATSLWGQIT